MLTHTNIWLMIGAILNFAIAALHLAIIFIGPLGYLYFGSADLAILANQGSPLPAIVTFCLAILFCIFGFYALSGAGLAPHLPWLTWGLVAIGSIYTLRGLIIILDLFRLFQAAGYPFRQTIFSGAALATGLFILTGVALRQRALTATKN